KPDTRLTTYNRDGLFDYGRNNAVHARVKGAADRARRDICYGLPERHSLDDCLIRYCDGTNMLAQLLS
ncbi:hypothetical protein ACQWHR_25750, partial [Salmonella enterica subsp. enterica serovar Infantis]